jgi:N-acetylmuramoyl-L-alanine amidase
MLGSTKIKVCIDAGHGGNDPGAVDPRGAGDAMRTKEADINLLVAHQIKMALESKCDVIMTRLSDETVSLQTRVSRANASKASLFVSIHCNAAANSDANGYEVWYCNGSAKSLALARRIHGSIKDNIGTRDRGVKAGNFYVLRKTSMPAVLVELGFVTNAVEERLLNDPEWTANMAQAIAKGIEDYLCGK